MSMGIVKYIYVGKGRKKQKDRDGAIEDEWEETIS